MNKDTLERLRETVLVPHGDPQLVLYTKLVVGLLWLVHLPLGFLYGAPLPFYLLLGGMMLLDGVNLFLSRRSASRARELGAALAFLVGSALLFQKAYVGYFSWFFLLIFSFSCTFALGLVDGTFINLLSFLWVMACLRGGASGVSGEYTIILIKTLGTCFLAQFAADACRDAGESSLASKVELAGKVAVILMALPLFEAIANTAITLIGG